MQCTCMHPLVCFCSVRTAECGEKCIFGVVFLHICIYFASLWCTLCCRWTLPECIVYSAVDKDHIRSFLSSVWMHSSQPAFFCCALIMSCKLDDPKIHMHSSENRASNTGNWRICGTNLFTPLINTCQANVLIWHVWILANWMSGLLL